MADDQDVPVAERRPVCDGHELRRVVEGIDQLPGGDGLTVLAHRHSMPRLRRHEPDLRSWLACKGLRRPGLLYGGRLKWSLLNQIPPESASSRRPGFTRRPCALRCCGKSLPAALPGTPIRLLVWRVPTPNAEPNMGWPDCPVSPGVRSAWSAERASTVPSRFRLAGSSNGMLPSSRSSRHRIGRRHETRRLLEDIASA